MQQLTQKLRDGAMFVLDVPSPALVTGRVMVRNHFSLVSAGTEGSTVRAARRSLIGKARDRPQQVRQVLEKLAREGPTQTLRAVAKKLEAYSPLGYSSAGVVIEVARDVRGIRVGDLVACGGLGYASHAEVVSVPRNLCVKLPNGASLADAAYNTLGAIALQGVRQADLRLGETAIVIGLGLLGQLTSMILRAAGVRVVGLDVDDFTLELARRGSIDLALRSDSGDVEAIISELTGGIGADAAIITAATDSLAPINLAGALLRKRGTVVVVGDVPTGFERDPHYYRKELSLRMSCSYGPGRYDPAYEEHGRDYPAGYVRWTENRNMQAFQELLHSGRVSVEHLTTHRYRLKNAPEAYDVILKRSEPVCGVLIEYDVSAERTAPAAVMLRETAGLRKSGLGVAFIGAGSYALGHILPNLAGIRGLRMTSVMTSSGASSRSVAERYGFLSATSDPADILEDDNTDVVFIATRHESHAGYVLAALRAGKHVFVEKPLCLRESELAEIRGLLDGAAAAPKLMIGFNRRYAPLAQDLRERVGLGPMSIIYRVNAGAIPADSWIQDPEVGGGRLLGEACHFLDFAGFLAGSTPLDVHAVAMTDPQHLEDTFLVTVAFENGSIATVAYMANGAASLEKEHIEVYRAGTVSILRDFRRLEVHGAGRPLVRKLIGQDKGQAGMVKAFVENLRGERPSPLPTAQMLDSTLLTIRAADSLRAGRSLRVFSD